MTDGEPVAVGAAQIVRADEIDAGHGVELPPPLVQHRLDVAEGLESASEARFRLACALRDRAGAAPLEREEMEHTIGLAVANRPQDDGLGLPRARHLRQSRPQVGRQPHLGTLKVRMARIEMYTTAWCGYCDRAKALLSQKGLAYEEIRVDDRS